MANFNSKTALVIGGTSGIGKATAEALLDQGATVHIVGRNPQKIADRANLIRHKVDITNREEVAALTAQIAEWQGLDYLVKFHSIYHDMDSPKHFFQGFYPISLGANLDL